MLGSYDALDAGKRTDEDTDNSEEAADARDRLQSEPDNSEEAELPSGLEWRLAEQAKVFKTRCEDSDSPLKSWTASSEPAWEDSCCVVRSGLYFQYH